MTSQKLENHIISSSETFKEHIIAARLDYLDYITLIQKHIKTLYGEHGDWEIALERYRNSTEYTNSCRIVGNINDIPEIMQNDIEALLIEEDEYKALAKELCDISQHLYSDKEDEDSQREYESRLVRAAEIAGLLPWYEGAMLNRYMIDRASLRHENSKEVVERMCATGLLPLVINLLAYGYGGGIQRKYPGADLVMEQCRTKYYYRGENAYYGKSQPSTYRRRDSHMPMHIINAIEDLRANEAAWFFLDFDAVKQWNLSSPNYMALGQHYGLWTTMMDITSDLKTALFFACCKYLNGKWYPLEERDFKYKDSRKPVSFLGGDSRYAVLYRTPTEITAMEYCTRKTENEFGIITPVGYQPFMRCAAQSAYIFACNDPIYDMYRDSLYEKMKIRLTEELCQWIYEEMDEGEKIYPHNDVPDISMVMNKINKAHHFSECAYHDLCKFGHFTEDYAKQMRIWLKQYGYHIVQGRCSHVNYKQMQKWNRKYSLDYALSLVEDEPKMKPMLIIG